MGDFIRRDLLKERFQRRLEYLKKDVHDEYSGALLDGCEADFELIDEIPAADVVKTVHGQWIKPRWENSNYCCDCSRCGGEAMHKEHQWHKKGIYPICPNCGAKMNGGNSDE